MATGTGRTNPNANSGTPAQDRAIAEVVLIVREILEVEEALGPLLRRREELEKELGERVTVGSGAGIPPSRVGALSALSIVFPLPPTFPQVAALAETAMGTAAVGVEGVANRMIEKSNPFACPFQGCRYEAISEEDLADHIAGCQPEDAG